MSAAVVTDESGRTLVVRKRGTSLFMQPGGKPEPGESAAEALVRELAEEIGLCVDADALRPLGTFRSAAAHEPGHTVVADTFALVAEPAAVAPLAEIEEARWLTVAELHRIPLAPLSRDLLLGVL